MSRVFVRLEESTQKRADSHDGEVVIADRPEGHSEFWFTGHALRQKPDRVKGGRYSAEAAVMVTEVLKIRVSDLIDWR
jgi:hypothetical protein